MSLPEPLLPVAIGWVLGPDWPMLPVLSRSLGCQGPTSPVTLKGSLSSLLSELPGNWILNSSFRLFPWKEQESLCLLWALAWTYRVPTRIWLAEFGFANKMRKWKQSGKSCQTWWEKRRTLGQPKVSKSSLSYLPGPLPPLSQHRGT